MASYHTRMMEAIKEYRLTLSQELEYIVENGGGWRVEVLKDKLDRFDKLVSQLEYIN